MKDKPVQYFSRENIERCRDLTPDEIIEFLDSFQKLVSGVNEKSQLISLKIEPSLLKAFKIKAKMSGVAYQTHIKQLMREWIEK